MLATHTLRRSFVTGDWSKTFSATENSRSLHEFNYSHHIEIEIYGSYTTDNTCPIMMVN